MMMEQLVKYVMVKKLIMEKRIAKNISEVI